MQTSVSEKDTSPLSSKVTFLTELSPSTPFFSSEDLKLTEAQKRLLMNHLLEWTHIFAQEAQCAHADQQAQSIIEIGLDNQKQHLLLLTDRISRATLKAGAIHALQETSEALGKESASVRYYLAALGVTTDLSKHDNITTEVRYYILKDIIHLCGGTYLFLPQQDDYLDKSEAESEVQKIDAYPALVPMESLAA